MQRELMVPVGLAEPLGERTYLDTLNGEKKEVVS